MSRSARLARLAAVFALFMSGMAAAQDARIGLSSAVTSVDPQFYVIGSNSALARNVFDALVNQDDRQQLVPGLATRWTAVDATTWEFELRQGVRFHDGSAFTAEDVAASLRRIPTVKNSPSSFMPFVRAIAGVDIVDPHRIRIRTSGPTPLLANNLSRIAILPKGLEAATTDDFNQLRAAAGTGPYRLAEYRPGERIVLTRNEAYWGEAPRFARVEFRILPNDAARVAALLAGDVDAIENVPSVNLGRLRQEPRVRLARATSNRVMYIHLDTARAESPFVRDRAGNPTPNHLRELKVRQAISTAIDRRALVERVMDGEGTATIQLVPEGYFGHVPGLAPPAADRETSRRLLAEAGLPNGFKLTFHAPNDRYPNDEQQAQAIAAMLTRAGIETAVVTLPAATYFTRASALEFSFILGGAAAETGEASGVLNPLLKTFDAGKGTGTGNRGRWSNARFDALLDQALASVDAGAREKLLQDATRLAIDDLGVIPLFFLANTWATREGFEYRARSDGYTLAENLLRAR
ncbi:MAG: ABC transporter substrate-binding protein [Alphaproteobacteria bacterium]|nr:ABC transporter substrate-binding protein [Alphaproteobacteria bacterium]